MTKRRRGQSGGYSNQLIFLAAAVIVLASVVISIGGKFLNSNSNDNICGNREKDTEKNGYCLTNKNDYDELVIVVGNTQNTPEPGVDFMQGDLFKILSGVFYSSNRGSTPNIFMVSAAKGSDGIEYNSKYKVAKNVLASHNALKKLGRELNAAMKKMPSRGGADYVSAILEGKSLFSNSAKNPVILVIGSGYNDSGVLNFATNDIFGKYWKDNNAVIEILKRNRTVKEDVLKGISVYWYNLGEVAAPQPNMRKHKEDTKSIYESLFRYLGAKKISLNNYTNLSGDIKSVKSEYSVLQTYVDELQIGDSFNVNETIGQFYPDRDVLIKPLEVEEKLMPFAKRFNNSKKNVMKVTGYVAFCYDEGQLGAARANTIKRMLVKLGVAEAKILAGGERGSPPENVKEKYTCNSKLPETERRTVKIEIAEE